HHEIGIAAVAEHRDLRHGAIVDLQIRDAVALGRPEVAARLAELLLGDVVGEAVRDALFFRVLRREGGLLAGRDVDRKQLAASYERDLLARFARLGVDLGFGRLREAPDLAGRLLDEVADEDVTRARDDEHLRAARPEVARDPFAAIALPLTAK